LEEDTTERPEREAVVDVCGLQASQIAVAVKEKGRVGGRNGYREGRA